MDMLKRGDEKGRILFTNLRDIDYDPALNEGVTFDQGMEEIHVIKGKEVIKGVDALEVGDPFLAIASLCPRTDSFSRTISPGAL